MIKRLLTSFSNQVQTITEAIKVLCFVSQFLGNMPEILPALDILSNHTAYFDVWTDMLQLEKAQNKV